MNYIALEDEFADIIKKARLGLGLGYTTVARVSGISEDKLRLIESQETSPSSEEAINIAVALGLKVGALCDILRGWRPAPVALEAIEEAIVRHVPVSWGGYSSNCYILGCRETRLAAVVDPGGSVNQIWHLLEAHKLDLTSVLLTHGDADHTGGLDELRRKKGSVKVICHEEEHIAAEHEPKQDGDTFMVGHLQVSLIHTPGHTVGSACYLAGPVCFTGDTLFAGSLGGATRYPGGYLDILRSASKLAALDARTILLPGHGPPTTVAEEKKHNPFIQG